MVKITFQSTDGESLSIDETKHVRRTVSVLVAKVCDRCKRRAELSDVLYNAEFHEFLTVERTGVYGSITGMATAMP